MECSTIGSIDSENWSIVWVIANYIKDKWTHTTQRGSDSMNEEKKKACGATHTPFP